MRPPFRVCTQCGEARSLTDFRLNSTRRWRQRVCIPCERTRAREYAVQYRKDHHDQTLAAVRRWRSVPENRARGVARTAAYQKAHPEKAIDIAHRRRLRKGATCSPTTRDYITRLRASVSYCMYCGKPFGVATPHIDHMMPLSRGGNHAESNLTIACAFCNISKGDRTPEEFAAYRAMRSPT